MAIVILDTQAEPSTPAAGKGLIFLESVAKRLTFKDDSGKKSTLVGGLSNFNTADVTATGVDTYVTGSNLAVPTGALMQVGTNVRWRFALTKTAAGAAAPVWIVRVGTAGTTGDAAQLTFTQVALQTGAADAAFVEIFALLRNVGAAGVMAGGLMMNHVLAATGFSTLTANVQQVTSAGFSTTVANTIVGVSVNPGASGVWTIQYVDAHMDNI